MSADRPTSTVAAALSRWRPRIRRALRDTFGLRALREGQEETIGHVLAGQPTLAVMPTGAGKSLCYQLPALLLPGPTLVVSPLIALMKDQCDKLRELGVAAVELNSSLGAQPIEAAEATIADGRARIVFTTPERLADRRFVALFEAHPVSLLVVDEAHCISQWGHDFRPAFLEIAAAREALGRPALLALTATATPAVVQDIGVQLGEPRLCVVDTGVYRPNLRYSVVQTTREDEKLERAVEFVRDATGAGIVYAATVKAAETVHAALLAAGVDAALYHGRLGAAERTARQDDFMDGRARVMVATNAFGLGIDKPDVRFVLHFQIPSGLDAYYQESGRAGRDGAAADCRLLYLRRDRAVQQFFLAGRYPSVDDLEALCAALASPPADGGWQLDALAEALDRPRPRLQVALSLLRRQRVVVRRRDGGLRLARADLDARLLAGLLEGYRRKREDDRDTLERMVFYAQTGYCRWRVLLESFAAAGDFEGCGSCDNCQRIEIARSAADAAAARSDTEDPALPVGKPAAPPLAPGDAVRVPRYGPGVVAGIDAAGIAVHFADGSTRTFIAEVVRRAGRGGARQKLPQPMPAAA